MLHVCDSGHATGFRHCPTCLPVPATPALARHIPRGGFDPIALAVDVTTKATGKRHALRVARAYGKDAVTALQDTLAGMRRAFMPAPNRTCKVGGRRYAVDALGTMRRADAKV